MRHNEIKSLVSTCLAPKLYFYQDLTLKEDIERYLDNGGFEVDDDTFSVIHGVGKDALLLLRYFGNLLVYLNGSYCYSGDIKTNTVITLDSYGKLCFKGGRKGACRLNDLIDTSMFSWIGSGVSYYCIAVMDGDFRHELSITGCYLHMNSCYDFRVFGTDGTDLYFTYDEFQKMIKCGLYYRLREQRCTFKGIDFMSLALDPIPNGVNFISEKMILIEKGNKRTFWCDGIMVTFNIGLNDDYAYILNGQADVHGGRSMIKWNLDYKGVLRCLI